MEFGTNMIALLVILSISVLVLLNMTNNIYTTSNITNLNSYKYNFTDNPKNGDTFKLDNTTFEFVINTNNYTSGYVPVPIGNTTAESVNNLHYAINHNTHYVVK
jgi:hypothetical protein